MLIPDDKIPVRLPVKWYFDDNIPNIIIIEYEKKFSKIESFLSKLLKSPTSVKRTLDVMNSRLWFLMDGNNNFSDIIDMMESEFKEDIIPSKQRITTSIMNFIELRLVTLLTKSEELCWSIEPFKIPNS
ncbi:MAG: hypothetical protein DWB93_05275 [Candidatus Poseidoniales archaeon]|nr:MAG: hypothetical protein DWB93_05275 [Candidatus Poseidoniales archaeon]|tara:strand:+ start:540 stop:926 length:387 start_codon:yes stop_codon:yes gene_type:complete